MEILEVNAKDLEMQQIIELRQQSFDNYEYNEKEQYFDSVSRNFALFNDEKVIAASLRLYEDENTFTIQKICSNKDSNVKGSGSILLQHVIRIVQESSANYQLESYCFKKLESFWNKNGFYLDGSTESINNQEMGTYTYRK